MHISSSEPSSITGIVGWIQDPNGRGTGDLLASCLLTLGMCVWSALHLNIPEKNETRKSYWLRNLRWVTLGVFVPELVVLAAWRQWTSAKSLSSSVHELLEDQESSNDLSRTSSTASYAAKATGKSGWTLVHSHYAGMGGFAVDVESDETEKAPYLPPHVTRLTLTTHGVLLLARCGHLPYLDISDLNDKSKTDGLAKAIVMLQATWMLAQTIGRLTVDLPVSLLEVNTLGHVSCAFIIYLLWWNKPREVYEPTILSGEWIDKICAYMYMSSRISGGQDSPALAPRSWRTPALSKLLYMPPSLPTHTEDTGHFWERPTRQDTERTASNKRRLGLVTHTSENRRVSSISAPPLGISAKNSKKEHDGSVTSSRELFTAESNTSQTRSSAASREQRLHLLTLEAIRDFPAIRERFKSPTSTAPRDTDMSSEREALEPELSQLMVITASNWPSDYLMGRMRGQTMGMALWFASMAYGGVHIAAWNEHFPTPAERYMWHFSSVYIACSGAFWFFLNVFAFFVPWAKTWFRKFKEFKVHWCQVALLGFGALLCGGCYIFARVFLVVEAFVSLRRVPASVYATPNWTDAVPHL